MKKVLKITISFSIILIFVIFYSIINSRNIVNAVQVEHVALYDSDALDELTLGVNSYKPTGEMALDAKTKINKILGIITVVGAVISVVLIAYIGFNYVLGSAEEKAVNKEQLITFTIGVVFLTLGSEIVKIVYSLVSDW